MDLFCYRGIFPKVYFYSLLPFKKRVSDPMMFNGHLRLGKVSHGDCHFFVVLAIISHSKMIPFELPSFSRFAGHAKSALGLFGAKTTQECVTCVLRRACRTTSYNRAKGYNSTKMKRGGKTVFFGLFPSSFLKVRKSDSSSCLLTTAFVLHQDMAAGELHCHSYFWSDFQWPDRDV